MRSRRRSLLILMGLAVLVAGVSAAVAAARFNAHVQRSYKGYDATEQYVEILPGAQASVITQRLIDAGVVQDWWSFRFALWQSGGDRHLQAGEYRFDQPLTAIEVVDKLVRGQVHLRPITFPEGLTIAEMARIFEAEGFGSAASFIEASDRSALIAALDPDAPNLEGYLFPDTYALPRDATADDLVRIMVEGFERAFDEDLRRRAAERELSTREMVTLASIIQVETAKLEERRARLGGLHQSPAHRHGAAVRPDRHLRPSTRRTL